MNIINNNKMTIHLASRWLTPWLRAASLTAGLLVAPSAFTASPDLATKPLAVSGGVVKPNLMFVMDTSLSMNETLPNDTLKDAAQCKAATKNKDGIKISALTIGSTAALPKPNTRLTIIPDNFSGFNNGTAVYLTIPGKPTLSGMYKIKVRNSTTAPCTAYNTTVDVVQPFRYNEITAGIVIPDTVGQAAYSAGNPSGDPVIPPKNGCSVVTAAPVNSGSTTTIANLGGGVVVDATGITATPSSSCYWRDRGDTTGCKVVTAQPTNSGSTTISQNLGGGVRVDPDGTVTAIADARCYWSDPKDNDIGTVCTANGVAGENSLEVEIAPDVIGPLTPADIVDARILTVQDDSKCYEEPPLRASKVQTLFYDPAVSYIPPPWPKKVGQGLKAPLPAHLAKLNDFAAAHNLLPNMDATYTSNWRLVRLDGTKLNASGDPDTGGANTWGGATNSTANVASASPANGLGFNRWAEMVYCDTPNIPTGIANTKAWFEDASRCKRNMPGANTAVKSPNYPYTYPAVNTGLAATPSKANFHVAMTEHQNGQSMGAKNPILDFGGSTYYAFGEIYNYAPPHYYNITPIEYCTNAALDNCQLGSAPSGIFTVPVYVRYCKTQAQATDTSGTQGANCQGLYTGTAATDFRFARYGLFEKVEIVNDGKTFPRENGLELDKGTNRRDCAGSRCTYAEEMTNIANWFAYYRSRITLMKSASGRTFDSLNAENDADSDYRVGFITVEGYASASKYLPINDFKGGVGEHKEKWFKTLYSQVPSGGTGLREVLSTVGRIYAGKSPVIAGDDPVQYSCQQNFTLLTTDGYWNGNPGKQVDGVAAVGNQDASPTAFPMREGTTGVTGPAEAVTGSCPPVTAASNVDTLADVAKYYYDTDIRSVAFSNCTGALGSDVCLNDVLASGDDTATHQHMTTFTLGLGVDGLLNYSPTYKTDTSGDFADILSGSKSWPIPGGDNGCSPIKPWERATIDDLWHAAVNGRGTYFSAKNPDTLIAGISGTLLALGDAPGSGSAIALSTSSPSPGDNYAYSARFTTGVWSGNLFARTFDIDGNLSANALWCVENEASVSPPCTGVLANQRQAAADTRKIYFNSAGVLTSFSYGNLPPIKKAYFNSAYLSTRLNQWKDGEYTATQIANAGTDSLVNYIRGQFGFEMRATNALDNRLYRERAATLGDIVDSDPIYVSKPSYQYTDAGYSNFVTANALRPKTIYVGANDGMLHAFNADPLIDGGKERWAFVPSAVMPNLWKLADKNYRNMHTNYVNAELTVNDVVIGGVWKTILVSGLGQGGRGYFAIDITDPEAPSLLWEFDSSTESNLGYSYGKPVITKRADGTWVVVLTSGYNNTSPGDGQGRLFVLDAATGNVLSDIATGEGSALTPSGLAQVSGYAKNSAKNNTSDYIYGGDLLGNLWRFNIDAGTKTKIAKLVDGGGNAQAVTVAPTLGEINNKRVVYVGTGKFIEPDDLLAVNYTQESFYAIQDNDIAATIVGLRSELVEQTLSPDGALKRAGSNNPVDWSDKLGWFIDFDTGERQNVKANLASGVLFVPTLIPPTGLCDKSGRGWLNTFNYKTGGPPDATISNTVSTFITSPIAGLGLITPPPDINGNPVSPRAIVTTTDAKEINPDPPPLVTLEQFRGKRAIWRELIPE